METIDIQIKSNAPEVTKETTSLRQQVKELRKEMEACEVGSDEYNDALVRLAQTTHDLREQQEMVKNSAGDLGTVFGNLQNVSSGVVSGFSAVNAITTLVGANNENLQKTMVKLQAGMALVQGMKGMEGMGKKMKALITSVKSLITTTKAQTTANTGLAASETAVGVGAKVASVALKGLKAALISTGIGAIVVLVGELVNGLSKLVSWIGSAMGTTNEYKDANEKLNKAFEDQNDHLDNEIKLMTASGASQKEIIAEKQRLIAAQKAETLATLNNAKARLQSLKADSAWTRFWHGENKVIKELEEETIPALQTTLEGLEKQAESLAYDYKAAEIKEQKDLESKRKQAAQKAYEEAKKQAEAHKKLIEDTGKKAEKAFDDILKAYVKMHNDINNVRSAISTTTQSLTDVEAWKQVYGTDPTQLEGQLQGIDKSIASYAADDLFKQLQEQVAGVNDTDLRNSILTKYLDALKKIGYDVADITPEDIGLDGNNLLAPVFVNQDLPIQDTAKKISKTFEDQFKSLQILYKDGIIDYKQFYDTLINIQSNYQDNAEKIEEEYITGLYSERDKELADLEEWYLNECESIEEYEERKTGIITSYEARIAEIRHDYAIKPLEFQKEVGEQFLNELKGQLGAIENDINKRETVLQAAITRWDGWIGTAAGMWNNTLYQRYQQEVQYLEAQKALEEEKYAREKAAIVEELNNNMLTVEQQAELYAQLEQLDADHLIAKEEFTARSRELNQEWKDTLVSTVTDGINAFASLTSALNSVSQAQLKEYDRQLEAGEISKEKYDKLKEEALKEQAALQIATTVMQTGAGIASAWATAMQLGPIAGPIIAGVETAALIANMVAQIISIKTALKQGLSGNANGGGETQAPDTSFTLTSPDAYQNTLSDETQSDLQANAQQNQRVYVVSSDISDAQQNEKTTVTTATF